MDDIFLFVGDAKIANYADDNTPYSIKEDIESLISTLESETHQLLKWFSINEMKSNADKCHLLIANNSNITININNGKNK